ncbi:hypothetical protein JXA88_05595 [Candidatus Fermentibacteria bacterium]|nr:hypothetical protein [Candidatus Fermentibacteria bacterium]
MRAFRLQTQVDHKRRIVLDLPEDITQDQVKAIVLGDETTNDQSASNTRERLRRFHEWVNAHDRSVPLIPEEMYRRERIYETSR